ncbi:MAG: DUF3568 family protein [Candidatus Jettenia sp.]|uniref:DUF3568 family protein n=1 Tax=Candidatus Jettenia caeni TaxID=247490 RepID=I3IQ54_9BACT|nr:DUF3568 family protein [Candidatus Jettenia sp. AMX1]MBC6929523.1 DUF3568 family protein [Candidatus Jettenia sp.]NUN22482.1 DUF3568 family protein [Candidatus Jettenia caeni]KAA0247686.1 MAG: DUF3568 family protein [Candidatus Jettenia sp. AMX1]MCE7881146.1 DUF3568 family protein [Candidatus Jettenia sp. AMX1]MCQ3927886.1 DUF3568 family protein [Candidatus Jettenia sp.]
MNQKNLLLIILLGIIVSSSSGCAALLVGGGAGAGTIAYLKGDLRSLEEASLQRVWEAAQKAIQELEFVVTSKQKDIFSAKLIAHGAQDKKVTVNLKKISDNLTEIKIRVGIFGDESLSRLLLERVRKHL